ncbi:MAG: hypothetical protein KGJ13_12895 [Patescibacteria group bacterium]|nr:hypothetical protein [Patescibacteria group bacterium]
MNSIGGLAGTFGAAAGAILVVIFHEELRVWLAKLIEPRGRQDSHYQDKLLEILRQEIAVSLSTSSEIKLSLGTMAISMSSIAADIHDSVNKLSKIDERTIRIEGAVFKNGHYRSAE